MNFLIDILIMVYNKLLYFLIFLIFLILVLLNCLNKFIFLMCNIFKTSSYHTFKLRLFIILRK